MNGPLSHRLRFAGVHFLFSLLVAALAAMVVLLILYPEPYRDLSGGVHLFALLVAVDVALGPVATAVVSKPGKALKEWRLDVALIVMIQLSALAYGLWTIYQARPVYLSFEIDRFRVVHAVDIEPEMLANASPEFNVLPSWGPLLVAVRPFASNEEGAAATLAAIRGAELSFRPEFWMRYADAKPAIQKAGRPLAELLKRNPTRVAEVVQILTKQGITVEQTQFLPLHSRKAFWSVLIHPATASPIAYLDVDPYPN